MVDKRRKSKKTTEYVQVQGAIFDVLATVNEKNT